MRNLDTIVAESDVVDRIVFWTAPPALVGEIAQYAATKDLIDYHWLMGHTSDVGVVAVASAFVYEKASRFNKYVQVAASLIPPIIATIHEYRPFWPAENVTDHMDTVMFAFGWAATIGSIKYFASRSLRKEREEALAIS